MKFTDWFRKANLTHEEFAKKARMSRSYVTRILLGKIDPGLRARRKIEAATDQSVRVSDWEV